MNKTFVSNCLIQLLVVSEQNIGKYERRREVEKNK